MSKYFLPEDEDLIFFRKAMQDVKQTKKKPVLKKSFPLNQLVKSTNDVHSKLSVSSLLLSDPKEQTLNAEDRLFFSRQGPHPKVIKKLTRGEIMRSACLDLHGMSVEQARSTVVEFLLRSRKAAFRCVQIVHGKGYLSQTGPKLKNHLSYWLKQIPWVLAFSSAQERDGGAGALYILLSRKQI
ncbi:MAG: Smr/MutS family protein [Rickettsiella sp.]|nr:Smr/MutS family protein [Rickettsiella sp.]